MEVEAAGWIVKPEEQSARICRIGPDRSGSWAARKRSWSVGGWVLAIRQSSEIVCGALVLVEEPPSGR